MTINGVPVSEYTVVIRENADETVLTAAKELCDYVFKATGVSLPVAKTKRTQKAIYLDKAYEGSLEEESLLQKDDSFLIKSVDDGIVICGKQKEGTLFGVYRFLQSYFGVEWYAPDCEKVGERAENVTVKDLVYDFPARMRFCHSVEGFDPVFRARQAMTYTVGDINDTPSYGNLRGLKFAFYWGYFGHTFEVLIPYEEFFVEHPEWFSFAEGHYGENHRYQICLTNPEVLKIVTERVLKYLERYPDCKIISVSQNDAYGDFEKNYCKCENCSKIFKRDGNYSAVLIEFVNKVAREVKKVRPDVLVHTFAYHFTEQPPVTVKPEDNVAIQFCLHIPTGASITDDTYFSRREKEKFEKWRELSENMFVWTYVIEHGNYYMPRGDFRSLYENTTYFLKKGVTGFFQQGRHVPAPTQFGELISYLTAKMFQNPSMSYEEYRGYMAAFCNAYFGKGGKFVLEFIDSLEERYDEFNQFGKTEEEQNSGAFAPYLKSEEDILRICGDGEFVKKSLALFDKAYALAETDEEKTHVDKYRLNAEFCSLCFEYLAGIPSYAGNRRAFLEKYLGYGATEIRENLKCPPIEKLDLELSPFRFDSKKKTLVLTEGIPSNRESAGDSTLKEKDSFGFDFSLTAEGNALTLDISVDDEDEFTCDENIDDWAQDCLEIYVSENRLCERYKGDGDFMIRINAHGEVLDRDNKVLSHSATKTKTGYAVRLTIKVEKKEIGFDVWAHDFSSKGEYKSTRYWNALAFSLAGSSKAFGVVKVK